MKTLKSILFVFATLFILVSTASCSDDDNRRESDPFALLMRGAYNGGMFVDDNDNGESVDATVALNTISLQNVPVAAILDCLPNIKNPDKLLQEIGILDYPVYFTPSFVNNTSDDVFMELTTEDLYISRTEASDISIDIEPGEGYYYADTRLLLFNIIVNGIYCVSDGVEVPLNDFEPMQLTFELYKK